VTYGILWYQELSADQWRCQQQQPEFSEVRNCVSCFSRELAVPPSKLFLLFSAAFAAATNR